MTMLYAKIILVTSFGFVISGIARAINKQRKQDKP